MEASRIALISRCAEPRRGAGPANVATRLACSMTESAAMRKASGLLRVQCRINELLRHTVDTNTLLTASLASDDRDGAFGNVEGVGEHVDELGVGSAIHRRSVETYKEGFTAHAGNA